MMEPPRKCHKCEKTAEVKTIDKWLCRHCFTRQIEEKIKHNLRQYNVKRDSKIYAADEACRYILVRVINRPITITNDKKDADWTALPWTSDHENEEFFTKLFNNKRLAEKKDKKDKNIKLFLPATIDDMTQYCRIKRISYISEKNKITKMLDAMEKKYPGLKASLLKSQAKIKELENK